MKAHFRNVDLEIRSASKLNPISTAMGTRVIVLYSGPLPQKRHFLALESSTQFKGPEETIDALCDVVESMPPSARRIWDRSHRKFHVGYELRSSELMSQFSLNSDILGRISKLGATLAVTYYRGDTENTKKVSRASR